MADLGHVKISRRMFAEDPLWTEPRAFSRAEAWIDLVQRAAWRPYRQVAKGVVVELGRGEVLASLRFLASAWGWGIKKVRVFLSLLVEMDRIRAQREAQSGTVYLVVNYEHYQGGGQREDTAEGTVRAHRGHTEGTPRAQRESSKAGKAGKSSKADSSVLKLHAGEATGIEDQMDLVIRAANRGMIENLAIGSLANPIPISHGSREAVREWLDLAPFDVVQRAVYERAKEYKPDGRRRQITTMAYFTGAVKDTADRWNASQTEVSDGADRGSSSGRDGDVGSTREAGRGAAPKRRDRFADRYEDAGDSAA